MNTTPVRKEEYEKKKSAKVDYDSIRDEIRRLEYEIVFISGRLGDSKLNCAGKIELDERFIETSGSINEYRKLIK